MPLRPIPAPDSVGESLTGLLRCLAQEHAHQRAFTYVDYPELSAPGRSRTLTWSQLYDRARTVAAQLDGVARPGERAVLLLPQGLDYVAGFLGCLLAGVIAVPLFPPDLPGHGDRVSAVVEDCEPACALVNESSVQAAQAFVESSRSNRMPLVLLSGANVALDPPTREWDAPSPEDIAYLQYTSGSTRTPAGVMITHRNAVANARQALAALRAEAGPRTTVSWLPLFHDMGLVLSVAGPLVCGFASVLMDPVAFLARPERWLRLLGDYPGAMSAAPNFAYDYCVAKVRREKVADLRLDGVRALINGAEPVRAGTMHAFAEAFAGTGLRPSALCPSYGLAEATVFVAADGPETAVHEVVCERGALAQGRIAPLAAPRDGAEKDSAAAGTAATLVACGVPAGQEVRIVDPATRAVLPEGAVGEILVRGPNVGLGYWKRAELTAEVFGARVAGTGDEPWLRTGDLGAVYDGRLLVTGRIKDLLIVDGRNHYPQDVEDTVRDALAADRRERVAVFSVPGQEGESVVAVAERRRDRIRPSELDTSHCSDSSVSSVSSDSSDGADPPVDQVVRAHVAREHGLRLDRLVLVAPGSVPRTSSGKVSRSACREAFLQGVYAMERR